MTTIRAEQPADWPAVYAVHCAAFPTDAEARLVDRLRASGRAIISLVAEVNDQIVGHILFSPVNIAGKSIAGALGLAPMAVTPGHQRRGIGSELIRSGIAACRELGCGLVVVLGHADYYPRFGFRPASRFGLTSEYDAGDSFMALELRRAALPTGGGLVKYAAEFAEFA